MPPLQNFKDVETVLDQLTENISDYFEKIEISIEELKKKSELIDVKLNNLHTTVNYLFANKLSNSSIENPEVLKDQNLDMNKYKTKIIKSTLQKDDKNKTKEQGYIS